ncbi:MAG: 2-aminoethylphosphonate--pyruvate transaminase [Verrucomicrobia bacterium]|nr:2-aminoethylphosphonate--pyruvate transaminase [Verrucomicrobiota bacterium]
MTSNNPVSVPLPRSGDKLLFTPGPLTTSLEVKREMLRDAGSWHFEFNAVVARIRKKLIDLAGLGHRSGLYEVVLLQGSGTFGVEAVFATCIPPQGKVCVLANGAYGERILHMLQCLRIPHLALRSAEDTPPDPRALDQILGDDKAITHVAMVHCETTTGILNPVVEIGGCVRRHQRSYIVDAMSSFGAVPVDFEAAGIDYLVTSANKCVEGVPGFSIVFARDAALRACEGWARSLSLDLLSQLKGFEKNGQFRYTPPTHSILAFDRALHELEIEGGIQARGARYARNQAVLQEGMRKLGFRSYLPPKHQSFIITSFHYPEDPGFKFDTFYRHLSAQGFIIYPGKISLADTFRIGSIGRLFESDIRALLGAVENTLRTMNISVPLPAPKTADGSPG